MYNEVMHYLRNVNCPEGMKRFAALTATSVFLEGRCYLTSGPVGRLYPNIFILVIAPPGNGKSMIANVVTDIVNEYNALHDDGITKSPKKLNPAAFISLLSRMEHRKEVCIAGQLETTTPVYLPAAELSVLVADTKHGNLLTDLLEMYECQRTFDKFTKTDQHERVERPVPTMLAATTPSFWFDDLPANLARDGFTSRCLLYYFNQLILRDMDIQWGTREEFTEILRAGARLKTFSGTYSFSKSAYALLAGEINDKNNRMLAEHFGGSDLMMGYVNRRMDQIKKIAMLLAAGKRGSLEIVEDDLHGALAHLAILESSINNLLAKKDVRFHNALGPSIDRLFTPGVTMDLGQILRALYTGSKMVKKDEVQAILDTLVLARVLELDARGYYRRAE